MRKNGYIEWDKIEATLEKMVRNIHIKLDESLMDSPREELIIELSTQRKTIENIRRTLKNLMED